MIPDHTSLEGQFLVAMPGMGDNRFEKAIVYLCAHSPEGSMGFVINKPLSQPAPLEFLQQLNIITPNENDKVPSALSKSRLYAGGPVEPGRGFVLHSAEYKAESTIKVDDSVCLTATLEILREIAVGKGPSRYLIALGYAGWSAGQLEEEISSNGWLTANTDADILYDSECDSKYFRLMQQMGINLSSLSADAGHA